MCHDWGRDIRTMSHSVISGPAHGANVSRASLSGINATFSFVMSLSRPEASDHVPLKMEGASMRTTLKRRNGCMGRKLDAAEMVPELLSCIRLRATEEQGEKRRR